MRHSQKQTTKDLFVYEYVILQTRNKNTKIQRNKRSKDQNQKRAQDQPTFDQFSAVPHWRPLLLCGQCVFRNFRSLIHNLFADIYLEARECSLLDLFACIRLYALTNAQFYFFLFDDFISFLSRFVERYIPHTCYRFVILEPFLSFVSQWENIQINMHLVFVTLVSFNCTAPHRTMHSLHKFYSISS